MNTVDFNIEYDNSANCLFIDASSDRVGLGTPQPTGEGQLFWDAENSLLGFRPYSKIWDNLENRLNEYDASSSLLIQKQREKEGKMEFNPYYYKAHITSVYDADSVTVDLDFGLNLYKHNMKIRLYGINAPEVRGPERSEGLVARDYLRDLVLDKDILLETVKDKTGKYGRYLGVLWLQMDDESYVNINDQLVMDGYAVYKDY